MGLMLFRNVVGDLCFNPQYFGVSTFVAILDIVVLDTIFALKSGKKQALELGSRAKNQPQYIDVQII